MTKLVEGSQDWKIAVSIIEQNENRSDSISGCEVACYNVDCDHCPMNSGQTLGQLRELVASTSSPSDDSVRQPSHYQVFDGVESIEIIARSMTVSEFRGFCVGNVLKYRLRAGKKSELATMEKDLNKAAFYQELFDLHKGKCYDSK